jgi:hypothetical protein
MGFDRLRGLAIVAAAALAAPLALGLLPKIRLPAIVPEAVASNRARRTGFFDGSASYPAAVKKYPRVKVI